MRDEWVKMKDQPADWRPNRCCVTDEWILQAVDIRQIYDKFPEKKGGLKELFDKGPQNAFFLVKFWADLSTNINEDAGAFYAVTSQ